jgi:hypothetical protein
MSVLPAKVGATSISKPPSIPRASGMLAGNYNKVELPNPSAATGIDVAR